MVDPTLADVLKRAIASGISDVYTSLPGKVKSYDAAKMLAVVTLCVRRPLPDADNQEAVNFETLPDLYDVPICFGRGGGCYVVHPLVAGDGVMVHFNSLDPSGYRTDGAVHDAADVRQHHLAHAWAVPCVGPDSAVLAGSDAQALTLEGPIVNVGKDADDFIAKAQKVLDELLVIKAAYDIHVHGVPGTVPTVLMTLPSSVAATKGKVE